MVHLGGTRILGTILVTMDADQGADLVERLQPSLTLPIHYDDYTVLQPPRSDFEQASHERQLPGGTPRRPPR